MRPGRLSTSKIVQSIIYRICEYLPFIRIVWLFVRGNQERDEAIFPIGRYRCLQSRLVLMIPFRSRIYEIVIIHSFVIILLEPLHIQSPVGIVAMGMEASGIIFVPEIVGSRCRRYICRYRREYLPTVIENWTTENKIYTIWLLAVNEN